MRQLRATARIDKPHTHFSRKASLIFRMDNLSCDISTSVLLKVEGCHKTEDYPALLHPLLIPIHADHDSAKTKNVDDILRIGWSTCSGIVVAIFRIHWPPCAGICKTSNSAKISICESLVKEELATWIL